MKRIILMIESYGHMTLTSSKQSYLIRAWVGNLKQRVPITSKFNGATQHYVVKFPKSAGVRHYCSKIPQVPGTLGTHANLIPVNDWIKPTLSSPTTFFKHFNSFVSVQGLLDCSIVLAQSYRLCRKWHNTEVFPRGCCKIMRQDWGKIVVRKGWQWRWFNH